MTTKAQLTVSYCYVLIYTHVHSEVLRRYPMPPAPKLVTTIREARVFARREYELSPLQIRYAPERSLPSHDTPLQTVFDLASVIAPIPPPICESGSQMSPPKIPKPSGEVSRLARGGYSLETTLNWSKEMYSQFKVTSPPLFRSFC
jgi:hypothetical protein